MSHVASVELEIKDIAELEQAVRDLGLDFEKSHTYRRHQVLNGEIPENLAKHGITRANARQSDYKITANDGSYEIGVVKSLTADCYVLLYDDFDSRLMRRLSTEENPKGLGKLKQSYATRVACKELKTQGYRVTTREVNGKIKVLAQ